MYIQIKFLIQFYSIQTHKEDSIIDRLEEIRNKIKEREKAITL